MLIDQAFLETGNELWQILCGAAILGTWTLTVSSAIGDVAGPPLLAHKAEHEGVICIEAIKGLKPHPMDKLLIPGCTYCNPQIASVGLTEAKAKEEAERIEAQRRELARDVHELIRPRVPERPEDDGVGDGDGGEGARRQRGHLRLIEDRGDMGPRMLQAALEILPQGIVFLDAEGRYEIGQEVIPVDALKFKDSRKYVERLQEAEKTTDRLLLSAFAVLVTHSKQVERDRGHGHLSLRGGRLREALAAFAAIGIVCAIRPTSRRSDQFVT